MGVMDFIARQRAIATPMHDVSNAIDLGGREQPTGQLVNVDVSLMPPDQQYAALVAMIEENDAANPSPNTGTPPFGEPTPPEDYTSEADQANEYLVAADIDQPLDDDDILSVISDAYPADIPEWDWYNDQQYYELGVPPGVPNYGQPFESGHTQITLPNPSDGYREFEWSGHPVARVARHENNFPGYNAGQSRGHMLDVRALGAIKYAAQYNTQQTRDLLLSEIQQRGLHNVVIADVPSPTYNEQVAVVDPTVLANEPYELGEEGVLP
jgi:hypothetical protein